jgi:cardiolipin synthase
MIMGLVQHWWVFSFLVLAVAGITDLLDGYLARLLHEQTNLGKVLDPLADKIFLLTLFVALAFVDSPSFRIPLWFVVLVVAREIFIVLGSYVIITTNEHPRFDPSVLGKMTTFFQMLFISWLFVCHFFKWEPARTYYVFLVLLALLSFLSFMQYLKKCFVFRVK